MSKFRFHIDRRLSHTTLLHISKERFCFGAICLLILWQALSKWGQIMPSIFSRMEALYFFRLIYVSFSYSFSKNIIPTHTHISIHIFSTICIFLKNPVFDLQKSYVYKITPSRQQVLEPNVTSLKNFISI